MRIFKFSLLVIFCYVLHTTITLAESQTPNNEPNRPAPIDVSRIRDADYFPYITYLKEHAKPPAEYVLGKFKDHDVVILGEMHEVRENLELIRDLIEPLYRKAGVRCFAMEILKSKNHALANKLVTGKEYDEELALRIFRDCGWPMWGFKEYMDIIKAIWKLNSTLCAEAERFKVIPLSSDWSWEELHSKSWSEEAHDNHMANILAQEVLDKGKKALVQIGYNHSFTQYRQPHVKNGKLIGEAHPRFGYILYEKYGDKIFQICLHLWHAGFEMLTGGKGEPDPILIDFVEQMLEKAGNKAAGFDIQNSPFANLRDKQSYYFHFQKDVVFSDIARGYVFLKPLEDLRKITWVRGFIDESNFERAKKVAEKRGWIVMLEKRGVLKPGECDTPQGLDKLFKLIFESP